MEKEIIRIKLENELDVVMAYKRAMQLSELCGMVQGNQTKFATAVSEICRNVLEHVGQGAIRFGIAEAPGRRYLEALVTDFGRGIYNAPELLAATHPPAGAKGWGIYNARKLTDEFTIETEPDNGTRVRLRKLLPANRGPVTGQTIKSWVQRLEGEEGFSPYAEIKRQNMQLLDVMEQLRLKQEETEAQLREITRLHTGLQASTHEISELVYALEEKNVALERSNKELDQFAGIVSHDLKAPLLNIQSLAAIILDCLESRELEEAAETAGMLQNQADRMEKLITDILYYSATGRQRIPKTRTDLNELLAAETGTLRVPPHVTITVQPGLPVLYTETIYLRQIMGNLLSNALKYNDKPEGRITVSCLQIGGFLQFSVADNGPGILDADRQRIFKMYEMLDNARQQSSTGIGLAIVKKLVELKGGNVWVESDGRNGSEFLFTWPAAELNPPPAGNIGRA